MADNIWAVPLALSNFNIVVAVLGGFISLFGLVSYLLKENYYLSEAREFCFFLCCLVPSSYCGGKLAVALSEEQRFIRLHGQNVLGCSRHDPSP